MEIKIGKAGRVCRTCETPFIHDQEITSLVKFQDHALMREDHCRTCRNPDSVADAFSVWTLRYYDPKVAEQQPPEAFSPLRRAFYEAVQSDDRNEVAKAYLAAQLLRRQKVFRLIKESDDTEGELRIALYTDRIDNRLIEVRDPNLTYAEMELGRQALIARLSEIEEPAISETEAERGSHAQIQ